MTKAVKDIGASVRARLLGLARSRGDDFQLLLTRYANERLLYRLAVSPYALTLRAQGRGPLHDLDRRAAPSHPRPRSTRVRRAATRGSSGGYAQSDARQPYMVSLVTQFCESLARETKSPIAVLLVEFGRHLEVLIHAHAVLVVQAKLVATAGPLANPVITGLSKQLVG